MKITLIVSLIVLSVSPAFSGAATLPEIADAHGARALAVEQRTAAGPLPGVGSGSGGAASIDIPSAAWTSLGPNGGDVQDVAVSPTDPNLVLTGLAPSGGGGGSLYRSTNGAADWQEITTARPSNFGFAVVVHPHDADTAWFVPAVLLAAGSA